MNMMRLATFLPDGLSTQRSWRTRGSSTQTPPSKNFLSDPPALYSRTWAEAERTGSAVLPIGASRGKCDPMTGCLLIMSRWKGPDQITNLKLITKVVAGLCFIPSLPLSLWCLPSPSVRLSRGRTSFVCFPGLALDTLLIWFHPITPYLSVRQH